jgi:hypothetical protein
VESEKLLPKRVVDYIHEMGVRALDHLAEDAEPAVAPGPDAAGSVAAPTAVQTLIDQWKAMATDDKEEFVERVAGAVVEVVAASAALPLGLKLGKKAARATKKVLKRETKKLRKVAKSSVSTVKPDKKDKKDKPDKKDKAKTATAPKVKDKKKRKS